MSSAGRSHWRIVMNMQYFLSGSVIAAGLVDHGRGHGLEVLPVYRQRYYAIIAKLNVDYTDHKDFEFFTKDTIRYYQQQHGYLFSHFMRDRDHTSGAIDYFLVQTWATMSAFKVAFNTPYRDELTRASKVMNPYKPQVMKIIADDFEYAPPASKKNPSVERETVMKLAELKTPVDAGGMASPTYTGQKFGKPW